MTRPSQGKQRGKPLKPGGPPTQGKKVGLTVRQTSQRDREKADEANVVSISELRHILRLAEPLSYEKNERASVEPNFNEKEQHTHETSAVECRVVSTPRDNVENRVTEKAPVVRSGLPPGHLVSACTDCLVVSVVCLSVCVCSSVSARVCGSVLVIVLAYICLLCKFLTANYCA